MTAQSSRTANVCLLIWDSPAFGLATADIDGNRRRKLLPNLSRLLGAHFPNSWFQPFETFAQPALAEEHTLVVVMPAEANASAHRSWMMCSLKLCKGEWNEAQTRWNVAFGCLLSSRLLSSCLLSSPLSRDELQFNCWMLVSVAVAVKGR